LTTDNAETARLTVKLKKKRANPPSPESRVRPLLSADVNIGESNPSYLRTNPNKIETTNNTAKRKKRILAIDTAPAATPPNPNIAATRATIKKVNAQLNISSQAPLKIRCLAYRSE